MKIIKQIFKVLFLLVGALFVAILIIIGVDAQRTSYLTVENNESVKNNSFLITNVNVIPMTQDTILRSKMVYVKNGIIQSISDTIKIQNIEVFES